MEVVAVTALCCVFLFCCVNVYMLEVLVRNDPGAGNLITFLQFVLISVHGLIFTVRFGRVKRQIPLKKYSTLVLLFFVSSVANNYAFNFNIPMPLHMVFRCGSLMANMVLGVIILEKKYTILKYLSVIMITIGIIVCTFQTGAQVKEKNKDVESNVEVRWMVVGILILTTALFVSARMGLFQETLYQKYGKHPWEALYFTHILPLPLFAFIYPNLWNHWVMSGQSPPFLNIEWLPSTRVYLFFNAVTQCLCVGSVYFLTTECTSLTVTLTLTLRKFISLLFSIIYFKNPFTLTHWLGTLFIFVGTLIFTELLQKCIAYFNITRKYNKLRTEETDEPVESTEEISPPDTTLKNNLG